MKAGILALGAGLALGSTAVQAQTKVTIYGIADAAFVGERGGATGSTSRITSGAASASRIGFRGSEQLGDGLSAFFTLETGTKIDTGAVDAAGTIFNRQAFVGVEGSLGKLALGRQYTPWHTTLATVADPFGTGYAGTSKNLFPDFGSNVRTSNTVTYASPVINGASVELAYSAGEGGDSASGRQFGGAVGWAGGPLVLRFAYNSKNAENAIGLPNGGRGCNTLLAVAYDLKLARLHAGYGIDRGHNSAPLGNPNNPYGGVAPMASTDGRELLLGLSAPLQGGTLMFSVMHKDDRGALDQDASSWGIAYLYALSKRTGLYAAYGHIRNRNGAGYTVANNTEAGSGHTGTNLGMRHSF
ncbi:porin [Massilia sp. Dwa41.01b]|uniref:porin n=1 Tax=unclassified Massilia TaxID=2609279 RepID=UPI0016023D99|nr:MULTISPECIES: porin [unclassified Massilia]QNA89435.1 porin [Massilia sp. Dwa41.01b]QNB00337.1 porin [Massilia sp. Se16.2.3]